jgi:hypothetical protein
MELAQRKSPLRPIALGNHAGQGRPFCIVTLHDKKMSCNAAFEKVFYTIIYHTRVRYK